MVDCTPGFNCLELPSSDCFATGSSDCPLDAQCIPNSESKCGPDACPLPNEICQVKCFIYLYGGRKKNIKSSHALYIAYDHSFRRNVYIEMILSGKASFGLPLLLEAGILQSGYN